jgi:hypothetical protein
MICGHYFRLNSAIADNEMPRLLCFQQALADLVLSNLEGFVLNQLSHWLWLIGQLSRLASHLSVARPPSKDE